MSGGWAVCPVCGAVVADTWTHAAWHETRLAEVIADTLTTLEGATATDPTDQDTVQDAVDATSTEETS